MQNGAAKLTVVGKDEGECVLSQDEVIVFGGFVIRRGEVEAARHAEVDFEVEGAVLCSGKGKKEAFAVTARGDQGGARKDAFNFLRRSITKDTCAGMSLDGANQVPQARCPDSA